VRAISACIRNASQVCITSKSLSPLDAFPRTRCMALPLHERALTADANALVRLTTYVSESSRDSIFDLVASARVPWPPSTICLSLLAT
jgi:hypothetical protein